MAQNTTPSSRNAFVYGQVVSYSDLLLEQSANRLQIGSGIGAAQGVLNATPLLQPLVVTTNGTFIIQLGGNNQRIYVDGYWADGCPLQSFTVPASTGSDRRDTIAIQYAAVQVSTVSRADTNAAGTTTTGPTPIDQDGVAYQYIQVDSLILLFGDERALLTIDVERSLLKGDYLHESQSKCLRSRVQIPKIGRTDRYMSHPLGTSIRKGFKQPAYHIKIDAKGNMFSRDECAVDKAFFSI